MADAELPVACPDCGAWVTGPPSPDGSGLRCSWCGCTFPADAPGRGSREPAPPDADAAAAAVLGDGDPAPLPPWRAEPAAGAGSEADPHVGTGGPGLRAPSPPPVPAVPPFPGRVLAAGVLWVAVGAVFLLATCGGAVATVAVRARQPGPARPNTADSCSTWAGLLIGAWLLTAGVRVVRGSARDTLVTSLLSLLVGTLYLAIGTGGVLLSAKPRPVGQEGLTRVLWVTGVISLAVGCGLWAPGVLGLAGRSRYLRWRAAAHPPRYRRPRRYADDRDEPDDRPRRGPDRGPGGRPVAGPADVPLALPVEDEPAGPAADRPGPPRPG